MIISTIVVQQPGIKLRELQAQLVEYGIEVGQSTICSFFHKNRFSYQKMVLIARQRDDYLWMLFACDVSTHDSRMFIFIDETGADRRNLIRKHGYSLRGKPARITSCFIKASTFQLLLQCQLKECLIVKSTLKCSLNTLNEVNYEDLKGQYD